MKSLYNDISNINISNLRLMEELADLDSIEIHERLQLQQVIIDDAIKQLNLFKRQFDKRENLYTKILDLNSTLLAKEFNKLYD